MKNTKLEVQMSSTNCSKQLIQHNRKYCQWKVSVVPAQIHMNRKLVLLHDRN